MTEQRTVHNPPSTSSPPRLAVEPMRVADIPEVLRIERASFPTPWSEVGYRRELTRNEFAHYFVLRLYPKRSRKRRGWPPLLTRQPGEIIGYTGYWLIADEAHITTLAVAPAWRRHGLGEWLLVHLLRDAIRRGASVATLEVRVSNRAAQRLYWKYHFERVGMRRRYYADGEDAILMTLTGLNSPEYRAFLAERRRALAEQLGQVFRLDEPQNEGQ